MGHQRSHASLLLFLSPRSTSTASFAALATSFCAESAAWLGLQELANQVRGMWVSRREPLRELERCSHCTIKRLDGTRRCAQGDGVTNQHTHNTHLLGRVFVEGRHANEQLVKQCPQRPQVDLFPVSFEQNKLAATGW